MSADTGTTFTLEITKALDSLNVMVDSIYAHSRWTRNVNHRVRYYIDTTNSIGLSAKMAHEINFATGFILGQAQRWLHSESLLEGCGFGSVIVSFPGITVVLDTAVFTRFTRQYRFELASPCSTHVAQMPQRTVFQPRKRPL